MPPWEPSSRVPPLPPQRITWRHLDAGDMLGYVQAIVMLFKEGLLTHDEARDALGQLGLTHSEVQKAPGERAPERCDSCSVVLDNLTTGTIIMEYNEQRLTLCGRCADNRLALGGRIIAQAKSVT